MKGSEHLQPSKTNMTTEIAMSPKPRAPISYTSVTDIFLRSLYDLLLLPKGWYFGKGDAPSLEVIVTAIEIGELFRLAGARKREVFPSADGGILVSGYHNDDTMEVFCGADNKFRFSLERNGEDLDYSEHLTLSMVKDKIWRNSWTQVNSYDSFTQNTTARKKSDTIVLRSRMPVMAECRWSRHIVYSS